MNRRTAQNGGLLLGGTIVGLALSLVALLVFLQSVTRFRTMEELLRRIDLPAEVLGAEDLEYHGPFAVVMRDVALLDESGDTVVAVPIARFQIDPRALAEGDPIVLTAVELQEPYLNLVQSPDGEFNIAGVMTMESQGRPVEVAEAGGGFIIRDVRIIDGRVRLATPWEPPDTAAVFGAPAENIRLATIDGERMRIRTIQNLNARLPLVRVGGGEGWRAVVASANARLTDPDLQLAELEGEFSGEGASFEFEIDRLVTGRSTLAGAGRVEFGGDTPSYDVALTASPVAFADLQWLLPTLPAAGQAEGSFTLQSTASGRIAVGANDLVVTAFDSRVEGNLSALIGGGLPATFGDTELRLDPLRIETIEQLGLVADIPYTGQITGSITSAGGEIEGGALQLDLVASVSAEGSDLPPSSIAIQGPISVGATNEMVRFQGVQVALRPLHLAALRPLVEGQDERLTGDITGSFILTGTPDSLQVRQGNLAYEVGDAPPTSLAEVSIDIARNGQISFDLSARADPLNLLTLGEIFPAIPFRQARLSGPLRISGTTESMQVRADLEGPEGGIAFEGEVRPGETLAFDLSGRVSAFRPGEFLAQDVPVDGPVTGTFSVAGTAADFLFNVDLAQETGRFALEGRFRQIGGEPVVEVAGDVSGFDLGSLIGRPGLFPAPLAGDIQVSGGGGEPFVFDVNLLGTVGGLDLSGTFLASEIPVYNFSGSVRGLDLQQLPGGADLPRTSLNATIDVNGRGTTASTVEGTLFLAATGSMIAGVPVDVLRADVAVVNGILLVDTLLASVAGARLAAGGAWGITHPAEDSLAYAISASDLSRLAPIVASVQGIEPQLSGSLALEGWVAGTFEDPFVRAVGQGENLRYEGWQAQQLALALQGSLGTSLDEIRGTLSLTGRELILDGTTEIQAVDLDVDGTAERMAVALDLQRDAPTEVALGGILELEGRTPQAVVLDSLDVRVEDISWELVSQASVRWGGVDGIRVSNLRLQRAGDEAGWLLVDGVLPPTGIADLSISAADLDLEIFRPLLPAAPDISGSLTLDATLQGPVSDPELFIEARVANLLYRDVASDAVLIAASYNDGQLESTASIRVAGGEVATAVATLPMRLSINDIVPEFDLLEQSPMSVTVQADSLPVELLASGIPALREGQGLVAGEITAAGTPDDPTVAGWATISRGAVTVDPLGVRYEGITGRLSLEDDLVRVDSLRIRSGGSALVNGTIRLTDLQTPELFLTGTLDGFRAISKEDVAEMTISGRVALSGSLPDPVLTGRLELEEGVITIPDLNERSPLAIANVEVGQIGADTVAFDPGAAGLLGTIRIDQLEVGVEDGVWLESEDARVEINGELVVLRSGQLPRVYGTLEAVRGTYTLSIGVLVREFDIVSGAVRFFGTEDLNPELDITAAHEIRAPSLTTTTTSLTILVHLTGTLEYPRISLTSNTRPPLPESELLNWLVFGQPTFRLTNTDQLAEQILFQEILGGLLAEQLGQIFPCDYFRLRGRPQFQREALTQGLSATALECGVQLVPDVFLTVEAGVAGIFGNTVSLGASLDWEINRIFTGRIAVEPVQNDPLRYLASPNVDYQFSTDLNATWEFGFPNDSILEPQLPEGALPGTVAPPPPD
ncbi:MAG TPA: translocation/assembly module TamB domain-containing protein, partial [Longimicrobiaceae bacterium]|nr:translocation/assembly module TamB domain-containing protein [Longimicrobiaceae bacterium]